MVALSEVFRRQVLKQASLKCPVSRTGRPRSLTDDDALTSLFRVARTGMQRREVVSNVSYATVFRRVQDWAAKDVVLDAYKATVRLRFELTEKCHPRGITASTRAT